MAKFYYRHPYMRTLLRLAPWSDLEVLREDILRRLQNIDYREGTLENIESYKRGETPTLPDSYSIQDEVLYAVSDRYSQQIETERRFYEGADTIKQYFTDAACWREVSDESA